MSFASDTAMGPGAEFDLIRTMLERWGDLAVGTGDDAAALAVPRGEKLVVSTDAAIEGTHFRRGWLSTREIGYRAVTAALSDLAAMAASPLGVLVSLELTPADRDDVAALADGIADAVRAAGTVVRGGNVAAGQALALTTTVLGNAFAPLSRAGMRAGDLLYVTGTLGGPSAAVRTLEAGGTPAPAHRERFARPAARIAEALWLARRGAVAGLDLSDGLAGDAMHLAAAAATRVVLEVDRVPLLAGAQADDVFGGEEYELLVAARAPLPADEFRKSFGIPLTLVGRAEEGAPEVRVMRAGRRVATPGGYDHIER